MTPHRGRHKHVTHLNWCKRARLPRTLRDNFVCMYACACVCVDRKREREKTPWHLFREQVCSMIATHYTHIQYKHWKRAPCRVCARARMRVCVSVLRSKMWWLQLKRHAMKHSDVSWCTLTCHNHLTHLMQYSDMWHTWCNTQTSDKRLTHMTCHNQLTRMIKHSRPRVIR